MPYVNNSVQRHKIADYIDISATSTPNFELMGTGFTSLNESPNAQVKSSKYINNPSASKTTTGYETQFPFASEMIVSEKAIRKIYNTATSQKTGGDCDMGYIRVELFNPSGAYAKTIDVAIDTAKTYYEKIDDEYYPVARTFSYVKYFASFFYKPFINIVFFINQLYHLYIHYIMV